MPSLLSGRDRLRVERVNRLKRLLQLALASAEQTKHERDDQRATRASNVLRWKQELEKLTIETEG
jgi:hypothetical protein